MTLESLNTDKLDADRQALIELLEEESLESDAHPLSDAQYRIWFSDQVEGANVLFNFASALQFDGVPDLDILHGAFQTIVRRHLVLTMRIEERDDVPMQIYDKEFVVRIPVVDLSALSPKHRDAAIEVLREDESGRVFDLSTGPLFHILQLRCAPDRSYLLISKHHIVSDGWSGAIFVRELLECFRAAAEARAPRLPPLEIQYSDFAYWQKERLASQELIDALGWWQQRLTNSSTLRLPLDRARNARRSIAGGIVSRRLSPEFADQLRGTARDCGCTLFAALLAGFKRLLAHYHGGNDVTVGTSIASRPQPELETLVGLFVNQLVLRTDLAGNPSFRELVQRVSRVSIDALAHQEVPFDRVVAAVVNEREPGLSPLFQVLFLLNNMPKQALSGSNFSVQVQPIESRAARFDLSLTFDEESDGGLLATFGYRTDIFDRSTIVTMAGRYLAVLERAAADPSRAINSIEIYTTAEKQAMANDMQKQQETRSKRFKGVRRKAIDLGNLRLIEESSLENTDGFPLVITPASPGVDLAEWAEGERASIGQRLLRHGAILFRGFGIDSVERFERFSRAVCPDLVGDYGDLPKEGRGEKIYKSTPYPDGKAILFHNESSHTHRWPLKQFFCSLEVAQEGGETPIVDCRELYRNLDPALARKFAERGLLYQRNFIEGLDVSWQDFFKTEDRAQVEAHLTKLGTEFTWTGENNLRMRQRARAVARHPKSGEWVFFNQIQLHHIECMTPSERDSLRALFDEADLPRNVYYGDGSPIEDDVIAEIDRLYSENAVAFPWQKGDVLAVDNMLIAHGRYPFKGARKIIVAMGEMIDAADLENGNQSRAEAPEALP